MLISIFTTILAVIVALYFRNGNPMSKKTPNSFGSDTYVKTKEYLKKQIESKQNGTEILVDTDKGLKTIDQSANDQDYASIINDWKNNRQEYEEDYKWYHVTSSPGDVCAGTFDERVVFSMKTIENAPESIKIFAEKNFQGWPQNLIDRIDLKYELSGIENEDGGVTEYTINGKISDNLYLVAWKREENNTIIRIQTYNVIFERTPGQSCKFTETYFSSQMERVLNAKKYFLLLKVEENPLYKKFLLSLGQHQQQIA